MQRSGVRPDAITFNTIISATARAESGITAAGEWLGIMKSATVAPGAETYNVSLLHIPHMCHKSCPRHVANFKKPFATLRRSWTLPPSTKTSKLPSGSSASSSLRLQGIWEFGERRLNTIS